MPTAISGLLVIDKPAGPTSFDVVTRVKRLVRARKAGHTGTLDPLATGVLVVCLGEAVKLQQWLTDGDKAYEALVAFGAATTTEDAEGEVVARGDAGALDAARIRAALPRLTGLLEQVPPMFSAVRVGGRRLHEAARAGELVERAPRQVRVDSFDLLELGEPASGLRLARLAVRCGKGTYVRTLAADLGRALGVPAHLAGLRRTAAGSFTIADAISLDQAERLGATAPEALAQRVVPLAAALRGWPTVLLTAGEARDLGHGKALLLPAVPTGLCGALDPHGGLLAVCEGRAGTLHPLRVLAPVHPLTPPG
jgi:tRNA pseudouridine55 synthase